MDMIVPQLARFMNIYLAGQVYIVGMFALIISGTLALNRSFCGQRDPILASTPKYKLLWKALATRPEPRRIGR